jgi:hypothetical protein
MFFGKFREAKSPIVDLGFEGNVLRAVVEYIVTDSTDMIKRETWACASGNNFSDIRSLVSLVDAASYFHLPELGNQVLALLEHILLNLPEFSLAIFQACKMGGPTITSELTEAALERVRTLPFKTTYNLSPLLEAEVLEAILKDVYVEMTECERFQILKEWMVSGDSLSSPSDRRATAANLSKHIFFERIDPRCLSTTVAESGLVSSEQLLAVYQKQAIWFAKQLSTSVLTTNLNGPWTTDGPPDSELPAKIKVEGACMAAFNGVYTRDGSFKDYRMKGIFNGTQCVFSMFYDKIQERWRISKEGVGIFYSSNPSKRQQNWPPCAGWTTNLGANSSLKVQPMGFIREMDPTKTIA